MSMTAMTRSKSGFDGDEDGGFGVWVDLDYEGFGLGVGVGEGVEAVGLLGFVVEVVVVVGLLIWCWWAMGLF